MTKRAGVKKKTKKRAGSASDLTRFVTLVTKRAVVTKRATTRLIRDGEKGGKGVLRWGKRETVIPIAILSPPE